MRKLAMKSKTHDIAKISKYPHWKWNKAVNKILIKCENNSFNSLQHISSIV